LGAEPRRARKSGGVTFRHHQPGRNQMPVILWLLGVPLVVVLLLMLFNVI
jgi:hypothetical protein